MKKLKLLLLLLVLSANLYSSNSNVNLGDTAILSDQLSQPFEVRLKQYNKGNLIPNPSFEIGKANPNDSLIMDFSLLLWQKVGRNVEWVDKDLKYYKKDEVNEGEHSIKIKRVLKDASETDTLGEGVLSDFIEVIPGNYELTYNVKLKNIYGNDTRRGTKLYKAVDIELYYYDKDKKPITGKYCYPYFENNLDNSFKGYTFSNFWTVSDFGWAKVNGRTYNYPYSEGDIPDNCRYVKIFFGLRGRGTMWVDDVDLRYSRWNFTTKERLAKYFDTKLSKADLLIPKPKKVGKAETVKFLDKKAGITPVILTPEKLTPQAQSAIILLKNKIESLTNEKVKITNKLSDINDKNIVFSIGNTRLFNDNKNQIPLNEISEKNQGYVIKKIGNTIYLKGIDDVGSYYAACTAVQLFDDKDKIFYSADIVDYPDFTGRSYVMGFWGGDNKDYKTEIANVDLMSKWKLNRGYVLYNDKWHIPNDIYKTGVTAIGKKCKESGVVDLAIMLNTLGHFPYEPLASSLSDSMKYIFRYGDDSKLKKMRDYFKIGLDAGATSIMLCQDDLVPHEADYSKIFSLWTPEDKKQFFNLANAHAFMINNLYKWTRQNYKDVRLEFCPPWYLNEFIDKSRGHAESYFRDLMQQIPQDVAIIWTGNTVRSLDYDMADIERYRELTIRYPMLWDNTLYARFLTGVYGGYPIYYPAKARMCNLFEPLDIKVPKDFQNYNDGKTMYTNGGIGSEFYKQIKYLTVADFEWNCNEYNPDFSLYKALMQQFGKDIAMKMIDFNDAYYGLLSAGRFIEIANEKKNIDTEKYQKQAEEYLNSLNNIYDAISKNMKGYDKLLEEIKKTKDDQVKVYKDILSKVKTNGKGLRQL